MADGLWSSVSQVECLSSGWWCNNQLEKYDFVTGKDDIPCMKCKIKKKFETTNRNQCLGYTNP